MSKRVEKLKDLEPDELATVLWEGPDLLAAHLASLWNAQARSRYVRTRLAQGDLDVVRECLLVGKRLVTVVEQQGRIWDAQSERQWLVEITAELGT